jgi:GrpB-like predicted nucleotidyltransferase (UPF0157 family)
VVPYDAQWTVQFQQEAESIREALQPLVVAIHHIGSTSIPAMCAKPVIDILLEVSDIEAVDCYNEQMRQLGYVAKGEFGIAGRRFFLKGEIHRTHHIHAFMAGSPEVLRHLLFRDYMIAHPVDAERYGVLKRKLAQQYRYDNEGYCTGKDAFIKEIDQKAADWKIS